MKKRLLALLLAICIIVPSYVGLSEVESEAAEITPKLNFDYRTKTAGSLINNSLIYTDFSTNSNAYVANNNVYAIKTDAITIDDATVNKWGNPQYRGVGSNGIDFNGTSISIEMYFYYNQSSPGGGQLFRMQTAGIARHLHIGTETTEHHLRIAIRDGAYISGQNWATTDVNAIQNFSTVLTTGWHHLLVVLNRDNCYATKVYVDGTPDDGITYTGSNFSTRMLELWYPSSDFIRFNNQVKMNIAVKQNTKVCFCRIYESDVSSYVTRLNANRDNFTNGNTYTPAVSVSCSNVSCSGNTHTRTASISGNEDPLGTPGVWSSTDSTVASVSSSSGTSCTVTGLKAGSTTIRKKYTYFGYDGFVTQDITSSATVRFLNYDNTQISSNTYTSNVTPTTPSNPTRQQDAQYTYTFSGWSPTVAKVTTDQDYIAQYSSTVRSYTITWKNWDNSTLRSDTVAYGQTPSYQGATPERQEDENYTYEFAGWSPEIVAVNGNKTYTATYTPHEKTTPRPSLTAIYTMDSNTTNGDSANIPITENFSMEWYGDLNYATPKHEFFLGALWQIETDGTNIYTWQYNGDTYASQYASSFGSRKDYVHIVLTVDGKTTKFYVNGSLAKTITLPYNGNCNQTNGTAYSNFNFQSHMRKAANCGTVVIYNRDATTEEVAAMYEAAKPTYTITWKDGNGNNFGSTSTVKWGATPTAPSGTPTKADSQDGQYTYTFNNHWNTANNLNDGADNITVAYGNATYYAQFRWITRSYSVTFYEKDSNGDYVSYSSSTKLYGASISAPATTPAPYDNGEYRYSFKGWYDNQAGTGSAISDFGTVNGTKNYYAQYNPTRLWTVSWYKDDGTTPIASETVLNGATVSEREHPAKLNPDSHYTYSWSRWKTGTGDTFVPGTTTVTSDLTIIAEYTPTPKSYVIETTSVLSDDYTVERVVNVTGGGTKTYNTSVSLTASKFGYSVVKWQVYTGSVWSDVAGSAGQETISFTVTGDASYRAVVSHLGDFQLTVEAVSYSISVIDSGAEKLGKSTYWVNSKQGITLISNSASTFKYWKNSADKVVSTSATYSFNVTSNTELKEVLETTDSTKYTVVYMSDYNQIIQTQTMNSGEALLYDQPALPSKLGYTCTGWELTKQQLSDLIKSNPTDRTIVIKPVYTKDADVSKTVTINYEGVTRASESMSVVVGNTTSFTAPEIDGHVFSYWKIDDSIVSYGTTYKLRPLKDVTLIAVYDDEPATVLPTVFITGKAVTASGGGVYKVSFTATRSVPEGFTLIRQGIIITSKSSIANTAGTGADEFTLDNTSGKVKIFEGTNTEANGNTTANVSMSKAGSVAYVRGYVTYKDSNNVIHTVYSNVDSAEYNNLAS